MNGCAVVHLQSATKHQKTTHTSGREVRHISSATSFSPFARCSLAPPRTNSTDSLVSLPLSSLLHSPLLLRDAGNFNVTSDVLAKAKRLVLDGKLAPFEEGIDSDLVDVEPKRGLECCPICDLDFPVLNRTTCCKNDICSNCFFRVKTSRPYVHGDNERAQQENAKPLTHFLPAHCPFCRCKPFEVKHTGAKPPEVRQRELEEREKVERALERKRAEENRPKWEVDHKEMCDFNAAGILPAPASASASTSSHQSSLCSCCLVLEEVIDENYEPTEAEALEYAAWLGMDPERERDLLWICSKALKAPLPKEWKPCRSPEGELYYFNFSTGESVWDHPCDDHWRKVYRDERAKKEGRKAAAAAPATSASAAEQTSGSPALAIDRLRLNQGILESLTRGQGGRRTSRASGGSGGATAASLPPLGGGGSFDLMNPFVGRESVRTT